MRPLIGAFRKTDGLAHVENNMCTNTTAKCSAPSSFAANHQGVTAMNRRTNHIALSVLLIAGLGACAAPPPMPNADSDAIRAARTAQTKALADNDLDRVVTYWTPDITIRRAMGQSVTGAEAARKVLEPSATGPTVVYQREATFVEVSANWPLAYEEGRWSAHLGSVGAPPILGGRYSAQWVKRDGKWLIRSEVFVSLTCADNGCKFPALP
jgi:ketosteroid isomerase-like protein